MPRETLVAVVLGAVLVGIGAPAAAQSPPGFRGPVFRIEEDPGTPGAGRRVVAGWLYNDGQGVVGLVRLRLEVLDASGTVLAEQLGWAYGNVRPGGRAYFRIPMPLAGEGRRISVESFVLQALQASESP
jgi:hypothetical protein